MHLLMYLIRFLAVFTVLIIRFLLPLILVVLRALLGLISISFAATVNDPREFIDRLAAEWTRWFLERGADREHINQIYSLCRFMVGSMIVLGWAISILFTVEILRVVFGFFI